ncbi:MAG TPA: integrase [Anaerolineae bacterium]|nr:integrase [Anaerolineae bacterium]HIP73568.1 integrase [Anaerolineae bacterium]
MTDFDDLDYDKQVEAIQEENEPVLAAFEQWLTDKGLAKKTIRRHMENVAFFAEYLTYYEPLQSLGEADEVDFGDFCGNWFPRKAMWASANSAKSNLTSFRKFISFMEEAGYWDAKHAQSIRDDLKENKEEYIETAETYYDRYADEW